MQKRRRFTQTTSLEHRLMSEVERLRQSAAELPVGRQRASVLQKIRDLEMTCRIIKWINSPGLRPPS
jgi:hypothetical protein